MRNAQSEKKASALSSSAPGAAAATRIVRVLFVSSDGTVVRKTYNCSSPTIVIGSGVRADLCITKPTLVPEHIVISFDSHTFTPYGPDVFIDGKSVECGSPVPFGNSSVIRLRGLVLGFYTTPENKEEYWRALDKASSQPLVYSGMSQVAGEPLADSDQVKRPKTNDGAGSGKESSARDTVLSALEASGEEEKKEIESESQHVQSQSSAVSERINISSNTDTVKTEESSSKEKASSSKAESGRSNKSESKDFQNAKSQPGESERSNDGEQRSGKLTRVEGNESVGERSRETEHAAREKSVSTKVAAERIIEEEIHRVDEDISRALGPDPDVSIDRRESPDLGRKVVEKGLLEDAKRELKEGSVKSGDIAEIKDEVLKDVKDNIKEDLKEDINEMVQEEVEEKISGAVTECLNSSVNAIADKVKSQIDDQKSPRKTSRATSKKDRERREENAEASRDASKPENKEDEKSQTKEQSKTVEAGGEEKGNKKDVEEEVEEERPVRRRGRKKKSETAQIEKKEAEEQPATTQRRTRRAAANAARKNMKN